MKWIFVAAAVPIIFVACAFDLAHVKYKPAVLSTCPENCPDFTMASEKQLTNLPCGYHRTLKQNSRWCMVGKIDAGDVYKPSSQCLTIECSNVYEAYLVMNGRVLNGFYLPVEDGYVALDNPIELEIKFKEKEK
jgi:hypothetical protein